MASVEAEFYRAHVDQEVDRRLAYHAHLAVRAAQIESRDYPDLELDAVPPLRRLNFTSALLLATYPPGASVSRVTHNGGAHAAVVSGAVAITSLTRSHMPRQLDMQPYQETLATDPQVDLFPTEHGPGAVTKLWSLLIYGGPYRSTKMTLCRMTFPTPDGTFAPGTIDMLAEYPDVTALFDDEERAKRLAMDFIEMKKARRA